MPDPNTKTWNCLDLRMIEYGKALNLQQELVSKRIVGIIDSDIILLLEHPPVFTLGRRGGLENLTVSRAFLKKLDIPIIQTERGGNITFHGPGQLVVYPIIDLNRAGLKVLDFVNRLEEIMMRVATDWGIQTRRDSANRGIWVGKKKLGSIGLSVRQGICSHGFALNVNLSLKPFAWINPCGLQNTGVTSMKQELLREVSMSRVRKNIRGYIESVFGVYLVDTRLSEIQGRIRNVEKQPAPV